MISRLTIANYKSIRSASFGLNDTTYLVGRNGSGKSNIGDVLSFLSEAMEWPLQTVFTRRGGPFSVARRTPKAAMTHLLDPDARVAIAVEMMLHGYNDPYPRPARYAIEMGVNRLGYVVVREQCKCPVAPREFAWFDRTLDGFRSSLDSLQETTNQFVNSDALAMPIMAAFREFLPVRLFLSSMAVYSIDPNVLREAQIPNPSPRLLPDGSNAASILSSLARTDPEGANRVCEILSTVAPNLLRVRAQPQGRRLALRFTQGTMDSGKVVFDAFNMSDGTLRALGILLALFQQEQPSVLVIEEPESSLHPAAAISILEALEVSRGRSQLIMTTHSPELLDQPDLRFEDVRVAAWVDGETRIGSISDAGRLALKEHLSTAGELLRMRILDSDPIFEDYPSDQLRLFEDLS